MTIHPIAQGTPGNRQLASKLRPLVVLLMVLTSLSCGQAGDPDTKRSSPSVTTVAAEAGASTGVSTAALLPADMRLVMEREFGKHTVLVIRLMRGHLDREPKFVAAASRALRRNTREIVDVVESVYGADGASSFSKLWAERIDALAAYSEAKAKKDEEATAKAEETLRTYPSRYGKAINELTRGRLAEAPAKQRMGAHLTVVVSAADTYAADDFAAAFARERTAYSAMFDHGSAFAKALVLKKLGYLPPVYDDRAAKLRSGIARLLGEHSSLVFETTRAVVSSKPAAEDAARAVNKNTKELLGALGRGPAKEFSEGWASSIEAAVRFAIAVAEFDTAGQSSARADLDAAPTALGARLSAVSKGQVGAEAIARSLRMQNQLTLNMVTAYAALDYDTSLELADRQHNHMSVVAKTLADVLEGYNSAKAPVGGAKTGGGGSAAR